MTQLSEQAGPITEEVVQPVEDDLFDVMSGNAPCGLTAIDTLLLMGDVIAVALALLAGMAG